MRGYIFGLHRRCYEPIDRFAEHFGDGQHVKETRTAVPRLQILDSGNADATLVGQFTEREIAAATERSQALPQNAQLRQPELSSPIHIRVAPGLPTVTLRPYVQTCQFEAQRHGN